MTAVASPLPALKGATVKLRHWAILGSFCVCVLLPALLSAAYLWGIASHQYHSSMRFSIKSDVEIPELNFLAGLTQVSTPGSEDLAVLEDFIKSSAMVTALQRELDLPRIFQGDKFDLVFTYKGPDDTVPLTEYWHRMVDVTVYQSQGIMAVEVRAFDPDDAQNIAELVLSESAQLISRLSNTARDDALRNASMELEQTADDLRAIRQQLFVFRNRYQVTDPELDVTTQMAVISELTRLKTELIIQLELMPVTEGRESQRRIALNRRLETMEARITEERARLGQGSSFNAPDEQTDFAELTGRFEELSTELEIKQQRYLSAQQAYNLARAEADRRSRYLVAHIPPTHAEDPLYPRRGLIVLMIGLISFLLWALGILVYYSLRERR